MKRFTLRVIVLLIIASFAMLCFHTSILMKVEQPNYALLYASLGLGFTALLALVLVISDDTSTPEIKENFEHRKQQRLNYKGNPYDRSNRRSKVI